MTTSKIIKFETKFTSYGHWLITMVVDNPCLNLPDNDYYWQLNDKEDEPTTLTLTHTTTNSRAIDGHDGYEVALASECLRANDIDVDSIDLATLKSEEQD